MPPLLCFLIVVLFISSPLFNHTNGQQVTFISQLTDHNFSKTIQKGRWIVVFVAPWCKYCKQFTPEYNHAAEQVYKDTKDKKNVVQFGSVDVTQNYELLAAFSIYSFPTIKVFSDGRFIKDYTGSFSSSSLVQYVKRLASFSIPTFSWSPSIINELKSNLSDPSSLPSSPHNETVSGFALRCGENCDETKISIFNSLALEFSDHSAFFKLKITDRRSDPMVVSFSLITQNKEFNQNITLISLRSFILDNQWPGVVALDFTRFNAIKQNGIFSKAIGVAVLAVDPSDKSFDRYVRRFNKAAENTKFQSQFRFGWMDAARMFRKGFIELSVDLLPSVVVFGSAGYKQIWVSSELNLTKIEDGLSGVINGTIKPLESVDSGRRLLATIRGAFDDLFLFSTRSGVTIFFYVCYFVVLDLCTKDNTDEVELAAEDDISSESSTDARTVPTDLYTDNTKITSTLRQRNFLQSDEAEKEETELDQTKKSK